MNKIVLLGRLTKETDLNQSGKMASCTIAVDRSMKDVSGNKITDFINLRWIGESKAQFAFNYLRKGMKILVDGRLHIDQYNDDAGNHKTYCYVLVDNTEFAESKKADNNSMPTDPNGFATIPDSEELPFH